MHTRINLPATHAHATVVSYLFTDTFIQIIDISVECMHIKSCCQLHLVFSKCTLNTHPPANNWWVIIKWIRLFILCVNVHVYVYMCVCVCVCVWWWCCFVFSKGRHSYMKGLKIPWPSTHHNDALTISTVRNPRVWESCQSSFKVTKVLNSSWDQPQVCICMCVCLCVSCYKYIHFYFMAKVIQQPHTVTSILNYIKEKTLKAASK